LSDCKRNVFQWLLGLKTLRQKYGRTLRIFSTFFLATEENNQPRVRPVTLVFFDERFWVLTGTDDAKVKQLQKILE